MLFSKATIPAGIHCRGPLQSNAVTSAADRHAAVYLLFNELSGLCRSSPGLQAPYNKHSLWPAVTASGLFTVAMLLCLQAMLSGDPVTSSVSPPDLHSSQLSFLGPVVVDAVPAGAEFGDVVVQPIMTYTPGQTVEAVFR